MIQKEELIKKKGRIWEPTQGCPRRKIENLGGKFKMWQEIEEIENLKREKMKKSETALGRKKESWKIK